MKEFKLGHVYYYADPNSKRAYAYFIRILEAHETSYRINFYNIGTQAKGWTVVSKKDLDLMYNHPKSRTRELNKNEEAKALLIGL